MEINKDIQIITDPKKVDYVLWNKFLKQHAHANIFQSPEMLQLYLKIKKYEPIIVLIMNKEEVVASLVSVIQKESQGIIGKLSARSIIWGGPLIKGNDSILLNTVLKAYNEVAKKRAIYSQFRNFWKWNDNERNIFAKHGYMYNEHLDILHDLSLPLEEQFSKMHPGRRKNIRRAEKLDLAFEEIKEQQQFDECFDLIGQTYKRIKLPFPDHSFFKTANKELSEKGILKTFAVKNNKTIIGCRMVLCYNKMVYDWFAGSSDEHLDKYPNDYLPWKIMEWGSKENYKVFDFGGAGKPNEEYGVRDYKLKFGGDLVEFGRFEITHKPLLMSTAKLGLKIYKKIK